MVGQQFFGQPQSTCRAVNWPALLCWISFWYAFPQPQPTFFSSVLTHADQAAAESPFSGSFPFFCHSIVPTISGFFFAKYRSACHKRLNVADWLIQINNYFLGEFRGVRQLWSIKFHASQYSTISNITSINCTILKKNNLINTVSSYKWYWHRSDPVISRSKIRIAHEVQWPLILLMFLPIEPIPLQLFLPNAKSFIKEIKERPHANNLPFPTNNDYAP